MDISDRDESPVREHLEEGAYDDDLDQNGTEKLSRHRSKDRRKSGGQGDDADQRSKESKDLEKDRRERRKEDRDERDKERSKDRDKYREKDKDRKDKRREREQERERETEKERGKDKSGRDREKERDRAKEKEREKGREKYKDRQKERENEKDRDREKTREKIRDKEREMDLDKDRSRDRDRASKKAREEDYDRSKNDKLKSDYEDNRDRDVSKQTKASYDDKDERNAEDALGRSSAPASELENRISKMKEERLKKKSESVSEVLSWVSKSRKLEEKNAEKEKALQLSKIFEEQDNVLGESEDEEDGQHNRYDLSGIKVLHGLDKVMDGGAVVLTLKDQSILADGDINEEIDMLENVEIGEQKRRDEAYKAAKKKTGIYDDKFSDDPSSEKKMLPQYDDPVAEEGVTLDARGRFTGEAEKKLEKLRRRLQGASTTTQVEDLSSSAKILSDYYTHEEMLQFKKPKKKKSLRKREKLDLDALEAEAVSSGLGVADLGSRNDGRRQAIREEQARSDAERRNNAYQSAYAKADEATKALRLEQTLPVKMEEDENPVMADDDQDLYKSLERARKLALKKQEEAASGPKAIALLAAATSSSQTADDQNPTNGESQENKVVFTEMEEFVWGLQLDEEAHKPDNEDVFMDEDEAPISSEQEIKDESGGWTEVKDIDADENPATEDKEEIVPDETIHEVAVGKGLSGALKLLKERGTLKESVEWGGRNMDKKKSKLVGIVDDNAVNDNKFTDNRFKDIRIERMDEFGRIMTPKEAFRMISHKFHGKGPGKMKQEKRMKQYQEELKLKQMKNSDTPSESVERMREAQARLQTPYLVLSGHVKPGQTSDPRSGFATVEKDLPGGLTPMLGNSKVEHFLGIKRKAEPGNSTAPKKPKS
ncbi:hypothetical protein JRO89_XS03G0187700 [Xanthoceras sorbifolium]|uniref:SART-1 family protein n=1 Tax=Xanthoceras sorbifolium TaxID=99658 RepID=A0ABQ8IAS3_9ROSI|nr:hypothetical protein JRO89_XS03G0187700 [Xanthoceras sorbifolium]